MPSESKNFDFSRPAARAIVIKDGKILVMKRTRPSGRKYMVTPGGRLEEGESPEEAVKREVFEETSLVIRNPRLVFVEDPSSTNWGLQHVYLCDYISGEPHLPEDSEEYQIQESGGGTYEPLWLDFDKLDDKEYPFLSPRLGKEIRTAIRNGFPDKPMHWTFEQV